MNHADTNRIYNTQSKEVPVSLSDFITVRKALADVLAEETALLEGMQIDKVGELQERKLKLTALHERQVGYFNKNPQFLSAMGADERAAVIAVNTYFNDTLKQNCKALLVAKEVNKTIVTCVTGIYAKKASNDVYNASGAIYRDTRLPISITLNKTI